jgi:N-acetylglucosamine-6-phosphate deacetylase
MMTFAPELHGTLALLPRLEAAGVVPSFGHSDATYEEPRAAFDAGVRHVTHLYNAMRPLHHREPGPLPAIFERSDVVAQLIVDGAHVAPPVVRWTAAVLGSDRCACITDGLRASGLPDGRYDYGGLPFESSDGVARYLDGSLVGTTLSMMGVVRRFVAFTGLPFAAAVDTASRVPARVLGLEDRKGRIAVGTMPTWSPSITTARSTRPWWRERPSTGAPERHAHPEGLHHYYGCVGGCCWWCLAPRRMAP